MLFVVTILAIGAQPAIEASERPETLLYVQTMPTGARVVVDGQEIGVSNRLFQAQPGVRRVVVLLEGHQPATQEIEITAGQITRLVLGLQRRGVPSVPRPSPPLLLTSKWAYVYQMKIEADLGGWIEELSGSVEYRLTGYDSAIAGSQMSTSWNRWRRAKSSSEEKERERILPPFRRGPAQFCLIHPQYGVFGEPLNLLKPSSRDLLFLENLPARSLRPHWGSAAQLWNTADPAPVRVNAESLPFPTHPLLEELDVPAFEKAVFQIEGHEGHLTTIRKHYELRSLEKLPSGQHLEIVGDGVGILDTQRWLPEAFQFAALITVRDKDRVEKIPLRLTYHLTSARPFSNPQPPSREHLERLIGELQSGDEVRTVRALRQLQWLPPDAARQTFATIVESLYQLGKERDASGKKSDPIRRDSAAALSYLATHENIPTLRTALVDPLPCVRASAIEGLTRLHDAQVTPHVVAALDDPVTRGAAIGFLRAIGPISQPFVIERLAASDPWVRAAACEILRDVGSADCLVPLRNATKDDQWQVEMLAREAVASIERRLARQAG